MNGWGSSIGTNELQDEGAAAFAECLKENKVLRELEYVYSAK